MSFFLIFVLKILSFLFHFWGKLVLENLTSDKQKISDIFEGAFEETSGMKQVKGTIYNNIKTHCSSVFIDNFVPVMLLISCEQNLLKKVEAAIMIYLAHLCSRFPTYSFQSSLLSPPENMRGFAQFGTISTI